MDKMCKCYKDVLIPPNSCRTLSKSNCVPSLSPISINMSFNKILLNKSPLSQTR